MATKKALTMDDLFGKKSNLDIVHPKRGDVLKGSVVQINETGALVDVGAKTEGIVPQAEIKGQKLSVGDEVYAFVLTPEDRRRGQLVLSLSKARAVKHWLDLEESFKSNTTLDAVVTGHNKGGFIVDVLDLVGFVPFSHVEDAPDMTVGEAKLQSALDKAMGNKLKVRLIELDKEKNRIILSEKEALLGESLEKRKQAVSEVKEGEIVKGSVTAIMPYGLMIEIDGVEGLVPVEEIGWDDESVEEALAAFEIGSAVEAKVIEVDDDLGKIKLSTKQVSADPWEELVKQYKEGDTADVKVAKITSYGVFANLFDVEGIIGLSSIPSDLELTVGSDIKVKIDKLDPTAKRLDLSYSA